MHVGNLPAHEQTPQRPSQYTVFFVCLINRHCTVGSTLLTHCNISITKLPMIKPLLSFHATNRSEYILLVTCFIFSICIRPSLSLDFFLSNPRNHHSTYKNPSRSILACNRRASAVDQLTGAPGGRLFQPVTLVPTLATFFSTYNLETNSTRIRAPQ